MRIWPDNQGIEKRRERNRDIRERIGPQHSSYNHNIAHPLVSPLTPPPPLHTLHTHVISRVVVDCHCCSRLCHNDFFLVFFSLGQAARPHRKKRRRHQARPLPTTMLSTRTRRLRHPTAPRPLTMARQVVGLRRLRHRTKTTSRHHRRRPKKRRRKRSLR